MLTGQCCFWWVYIAVEWIHPLLLENVSFQPENSKAKAILFLWMFWKMTVLEKVTLAPHQVQFITESSILTTMSRLLVAAPHRCMNPVLERGFQQWGWAFPLIMLRGLLNELMARYHSKNKRTWKQKWNSGGNQDDKVVIYQEWKLDLWVPKFAETMSCNGNKLLKGCLRVSNSTLK